METTTNTSLVRFLKKDLYTKNSHNVKLWLIGAEIGEIRINMIEPKSFFQKLEKLHGFISMVDLSWVNELCYVFLGRAYSQPKVVQKITTTSIPKIKVGVGANNVSASDYRVDIKKMSSWPASNPTRIYVDAEVNGKEFHYYICKNGKQGRFPKGANETGIPFSVMVPYEMKFLGLSTEAEVIGWSGVKGFYNKKAA